VDSGNSWQPKIKVDDKKNISSVDVLSMAIDPADANIIYLGTMANGLFVSKDGAETWTQVAFADKAYGLVFDPADHNVMYASGVFKNRGKIYKRLLESEEWKEVYTEPADGTVISSLAINKVNSQVLFAGTSEGVIIKTVDGGATWKNIKKADGPVTSIVFDSANDWHLFFGIFQLGVLETKDGGKNIEDITKNINTVSSVSSVNSVVSDPSAGGVIYVGTDNGLFKKTGSGDSWKNLNIIESSRVFPIRTVAINPKNSNELMYVSAQVVYKSTDGGAHWTTFQVGASKEISVLKYDESDSNRIYGGLRKY